MSPRRKRSRPAPGSGLLAPESGQALVLTLGVVAVLLVGSMVLAAFGQALGGKGRHQRAADLAAMSAASSMRRDYPRLFEPPVLANGLPNPRHMSTPVYLARARAAARSGATRNHVSVAMERVTFPGGSFAPTRVAVRLSGRTSVRVGERDRSPVSVSGRAEAEITPGAGNALDQPARGSGGGYDGPLAYRMGKPMRPDVAGAFDRMAGAARRDGLALSVTSGFRSDAEQAKLFAANPNPKWVAPPGTSLHRYGTELDLGPPGAHGWLAQNARRFGFIHRYAWERLPVSIREARSPFAGGVTRSVPVVNRATGMSAGADCSDWIACSPLSIVVRSEP